MVRGVAPEALILARFFGITRSSMETFSLSTDTSSSLDDCQLEQQVKGDIKQLITLCVWFPLWVLGWLWLLAGGS